MVGLLQAPPGTKLFEKLKNENRLLNMFPGDSVVAATNIIPKMNLALLQDGYKRILLSIYSPKPYYQRVMTFLKEYKTPKIRAQFKWHDLSALFKSFILLGFIGRERGHYWKLIFWTMFRKPKLIHLALTLAVYGYHFRKICNLQINSKL